MITLVIIIALLSFLYIYLSIRKSRKSKIDIPGPKPLFLFGNTLDFVLKPTYEWLDVFAKYLKTYGNIVRVYDGPFSSFVLVADPKFMEFVLSSTKYIDKTYQYEYLRGWLGYGLIVSTGHRWKTFRRILTPAFHFSVLEHFIEVFNSAGQIFIDKLKTEVGKQSVDISDYVGRYALDVISEAAMGIKVDAQANDTSPFVNNTKIMGKIFLTRLLSILHVALYPFTLNYYREKAALKVLHAHTDSIIQKKKAELSSKDIDLGGKKKLAFLDLLLTYNIDGKPLSDLDIRAEVDTFMFAGHDTTSTALSFAMYALANNAEIQEKAYLEQQDIFGDSQNADITNSDLKKMRYLELVIKETLRLYSPVPIIGRQFAEDTEFDGVIYPKGTVVSFFIYLIQRNPEYYPEPLKFKPERFENINLPNPYAYIPFSAGPRNCIGR